MKQNYSERLPHETSSIIEAKIRGQLPIGPVANFTGGGGSIRLPQAMTCFSLEAKIAEMVGSAQRYRNSGLRL